MFYDQESLTLSQDYKLLFDEVNPMLMIDTPITQTSNQIDNHSHNDELNRLLCAAVVSKSFRNVLLSNPELAVASGYQGETFNLSPDDRSWLYSTRPTTLVDLAANMVAYQQTTPVKLPVESAHHLVRVN
jgi:hypothetical protein